MHITMSRVALMVLAKVMEVKKVEFDTLNHELKNVLLLYCSGDMLLKFGYTSLH